MGNYQWNWFLSSTLRKNRIFQKQKPLATLTITAVILGLRANREFVLPPWKTVILCSKWLRVKALILRRCSWSIIWYSPCARKMPIAKSCEGARNWWMEISLKLIQNWGRIILLIDLSNHYSNIELLSSKFLRCRRWKFRHIWIEIRVTAQTHTWMFTRCHKSFTCLLQWDADKLDEAKIAKNNKYSPLLTPVTPFASPFQ